MFSTFPFPPIGFSSLRLRVNYTGHRAQLQPQHFVLVKLLHTQLQNWKCIFRHELFFVQNLTHYSFLVVVFFFFSPLWQHELYSVSVFIQPLANQKSKWCGGTVETRAFNHTNTVVWREKEKASTRCAEELERDRSKPVEDFIIKKFILHWVLKLMRSQWSCLTMGMIWVSFQGLLKLFWANTYSIFHCFLP